MEDKNFKQQKAKFNFVIIYILGFVISAFFEFYWISYYPYDYFMLAGIGIILCILGYLSIDGILNIIHSAEQKRDEQAETLIKAGKAIYLTTKRMALEQSHTLPEVSDVPKDLNSLVNDLAKANERSFQRSRTCHLYPAVTPGEPETGNFRSEYFKCRRLSRYGRASRGRYSGGS